MTEPQQLQWVIEDVTRRLNETSEGLIQLLTDKDQTKACEAIQQLLEEQKRTSLLKVAFVGQYSAGKSTIISALTGDRSIKIDADIATDEAADYAWNGIKLTDTPGLWTERQDHDEKSYRAIQEADLLVFVVTNELFDPVTLANFKKLAFEDSYKHKMMLVVNKMSREDGTFEELKQHYTDSLQEAIAPYQLSDFPTSFIDAADYLDSDGDYDLIVASHMQDFIQKLNHFVEERGILGKLDQPLRELLAIVRNVQIQVGVDQETKKFFALLERIEHRLLRSSKRSRLECESLSNDLRAKIIAMGSSIALKIGSEDVDLEGEFKEAETRIEHLCETKSQELETHLEGERTELQGEITEVLESELAQAYLRDMERSGLNLHPGASIGSTFSSLQANLKSLNEIATQVSNGMLQLIGTSSSGMFFKATEVSGSQAHQVVYSVGKFFGANFKPYGAVNIAKNLGNVAKALGPALAIFGAVVEVYDAFKQQERNQKIREARGECRNSFISAAEDLQEQFQKQFQTYHADFYEPILQMIETRRKVALSENAAQDQLQKALGTFAATIEETIRMIAKQAEKPLSV